MRVTVAGLDTAAIHAACALAGAGGTVCFENGTYIVDGLLSAYDGQRWELDSGAIIKRSATTTGPILKLTAPGLKLRGGMLDGNRAGNPNAAVGIDSVLAFDGRDFKLTGVNGWGVAIDNADLKLIDVLITDTKNAGVIWRNTNVTLRKGPHLERVTVDRSQEPVEGFTSGGILVQALEGKYVLAPRIINCDVMLASQDGYDAVCIEVLRAIKGHISGCNPTGGRIGISMGADNYSTITGNAAQAQTDYAYEIVDCLGTVMAGNNGSGFVPSTWGIRVTGSSLHVRSYGTNLVGFATPIEVLGTCSDCVMV
jgi:hypothetical protein